MALLTPAWAGAASEPRIAVHTGPLPVALQAPAHGAVLTAGSAVALAWKPLPAAGPLAGLPQWDEWEAFLSVDGGVTYPFRITPHLDGDLRRVLWEVPHLPTRDARLLLRLGDERRETAFALPQRFTILADPDATPVAADAAVGVVFHRGEAALPGHPGVVSWVEGSRRGASARRMKAVDAVGLKQAVTAPEHRHGEALLGSDEDSVGPPAVQNGSRLSSPPSRTSRRALIAAARGRAPSDLLLLLRRRNE
jgi:hypothetical protein